MKNYKKYLTRRDFIRGTVGTTLATSLLGIPWVNALRNSSQSSSVTVIRHKNVMGSDFRIDTGILKNMLDQVICKVTGERLVHNAWATLIKPGDIVGLVPTPHLNPTHNELIDVVKSSLIEHLKIPGNNIIMANGSKKNAERCSVLICMPALKGHWLTGIGTVIKNYILYSGRPSNYHEEKSSKLGEIWLLPGVKGKTKLVLVDALYPLCDKGPQPDPRYKWTYNGLIAGTDPVAVEKVCLEIITKKRHQLRGEPWPITPPPICVEAADKIYGLGTSDLKKIRIESIGWEEGLLL